MRSASPVPSTASANLKRSGTTREKPRTKIENAMTESIAKKEVEDEFSNFGRIVADFLRKLSKVSQVVKKRKKLMVSYLMLKWQS